MHPAFDSRIEIGAALYWVRRDFDLIRRIEQAFGPLAELDARLRRSTIKAEDVVRLTGIVLGAQQPAVEIVREHVADAGIAAASAQLAELVVQLFAGHKRTIAWLKAEHAKRRDDGEDDDGEDDEPEDAARPPMPV